MRAMVLEAPHTALKWMSVPDPHAGPNQMLVKVEACGVCRTDLHLLDGELPQARYPISPGHEVVGTIVETGIGVTHFSRGDRVGVPWLASACGACGYCRVGRENLCDHPQFTGCTVNGGYAEYVVADARFCLRLPSERPAAELAPWLCAGLIGYRALRAAGRGHRLGIYGFGAAAHIVAQIAIFHGQEVYAFTRPGDGTGQAFARSLGASWAGGSDESPPFMLDAAIIFAPVGSLVPAALKVIRKGGIVVCAGIHMSDIPSFPYELLWGERQVASIANLTRRDGTEFLALASRIPVKTSIVAYPVQKANEALAALRAGTISGAAVLTFDNA